MTEKTPYIVVLNYKDMKARKKIKVEKGAMFRLTGMIAVAVMTDERPRVVLALTEISDEEFKGLAKKYGVNLNAIRATITEIKEEKRGERELKFGE